MRGPEEWPSCRKADRIRLTGPAAIIIVARAQQLAAPIGNGSVVLLAGGENGRGYTRSFLFASSSSAAQSWLIKADSFCLSISTVICSAMIRQLEFSGCGAIN